MIQIEYKVASEFDVTRQAAKAEVVRRVNDGPWVTARIVTPANNQMKLAVLERLAIDEIAAEVKSDCEAADRLGLAYSIHDSRVTIDASSKHTKASDRSDARG